MRLLDFFKRPPMPWRGRTPLAEFLRTWDGKAALPDEERTEKGRWAAGAQDGVFEHHGGAEPDAARAQRLAREVIRAASDAGDAARARLYALAMEHPVQSLLDPIGEALIAEKVDAAPVGALGRWLAEHAAHREPAKLGLYLLGLGGTPDDLPLLRLFARHDEFTKFASVSAANLAPDAIGEWLEMAKHVHGWGKVALVERIATEGEERADVRDWLLRHGCENSIMNEYLGYGCAVAGRLHEALAAEDVDEELLRGASEIVRAMIHAGGAAAGIDDYEHAEADVLALLRHLAAHPSFESCVTAGEILRWIDGAEKRAEAFRDAVRERCRAILSALSEDELRRRFVDGSSLDRFQTWRLAPLVGVDLWEDAFALLQREPLDQSHYMRVLPNSDAMRARRVIAFAEEHLPLGEIASGPGDEMGFGEKFAAHGCLDQLLFRMREGDVFSPRLIVTALRSPVTRNRNVAIAAIERWLPREVPEVVAVALRDGMAVEPNEKTREAMRACLAKLA